MVNWLHGWLAEKATTPGKGIGVNMELGSGFDLDAQRVANAEKLRQVCDDAVSDPKYWAHDITGDGKPETFCNRALISIANNMGCHDLDGLLANDMVRRANASIDFRADSAERAAQHAMRGGLAFAGKEYPGHGHVAAVYPRSCELSGSWGKLVPIIANVGKRNGIMKTSEAFPVSLGEPQYFLWKPDQA